jgi:hypothetical protein
LLNAVEVAEGLGELAVEVGFVAEEAGQVFGVGEEGLGEGDAGAFFQFLLGLACGFSRKTEPLFSPKLSHGRILLGPDSSHEN